MSVRLLVALGLLPSVLAVSGVAVVGAQPTVPAVGTIWAWHWPLVLLT